MGRKGNKSISSKSSKRQKSKQTTSRAKSIDPKINPNRKSSSNHVFAVSEKVFGGQLFRPKSYNDT